MEPLVPVAALLLSIITFISLQFTNRRSANREWVQSLEHRLEACEVQHRECEEERTRLTSENVDLMRRLVRLGDP